MPRLDRASIAERLKAGRALRKKVPRKDHASWTAPANRPDPIKLLIESDRGRIPSLLPIRTDGCANRRSRSCAAPPP